MVGLHPTSRMREEIQLMIGDMQVKLFLDVWLPFILNIHAAFIFAFSIDCTDSVCYTTYEGALLYFIVDNTGKVWKHQDIIVFLHWSVKNKYQN